MSFGTHLRSLRESRGLSRDALRDQVRDRFGAQAAFSTSSLENWENDNARITAETLARIVVVLGADYEDVFSKLVIIPNQQEEP